jgi:serine/threonine-protein kinase RsbW
MAATTLSLSVANRMDEVPRLVELLDSFGAGAGLSDDLVFRLTVTLDEVVTNIVRHGFNGQGGHDILLGITVDEALVTATVEDHGPPFDLRTVPPADVNAPIELRPIGGLGVHLVRLLTHSLDYRRDGHRNILTLTFVPDVDR